MNSDWLQAHEEYLRLGENAEARLLAYHALFEAEIITADIIKIREGTHKGWALGDSKFQATIELLSQRRASSKGIGRPKKME